MDQRYRDNPKTYFIFETPKGRFTVTLFPHRHFWVCAGQDFNKLSDSDGYTTADTAAQALEEFLDDFDPVNLCLSQDYKFW